jgi:hypothetical protein
MDLEKEIVNALYRKLGGYSFNSDVRAPDGTLLGVRAKRYAIARFVRAGGLPVLMDLLVADPAYLGNYGSKHVRDGFKRLSADGNGRTLAVEVSRLLRNREKA